MYELHFNFIAISDQKAGDIMEKMILDTEGKVERSISFSIEEKEKDKVKSELKRLTKKLFEIDPRGDISPPIKNLEYLIISTHTF